MSACSSSVEPLTTEHAQTIVLRFVYRGESLRNGRVLRLSNVEHLSGKEVLAALATEEANVDLQRWAVFFYSHALEGWERLYSDSDVVPANREGVRRVELMLEAAVRGQKTATTVSQAELASTAVASLLPEGPDGGDGAPSAGYFGIGVYNSKAADNVGTLWRSAYMLGAAFIYTIGSRNAWEKVADTYKSWRHVPAFRYENWEAFCAVAPFNCQWVAVEMGGEPLSSFVHPERCVYLLGAEDAGKRQPYALPDAHGFLSTCVLIWQASPNRLCAHAGTASRLRAFALRATTWLSQGCASHCTVAPRRGTALP